MELKITKIVSGGQTGVDRAALDFALLHGIPHGGWIPKGRLTEEGPLSHRYLLKETTSSNYGARTEKNIQDSDGTLILYYNQLTGGSLLTLKIAQKIQKPVITVNLKDQKQSIQRVSQWLLDHSIQNLNIAGPRISSSPGIDQDTMKFLTLIFKYK